MAFTFSIDPGIQSQIAIQKTQELMDKGILLKDDRELIGPIVQVENAINCLLGKKIQLHNGFNKDDEMDYYPNE